MTQNEAKREIIAEWRRWTHANNTISKFTGSEAMIFFGYLQKEKQHLLEFRYGGDKWQIVHAWLLGERLVSD